MRMSRMMLKTLREAPADADLPSHQLILRAGLAVPLAAGLYCYTPLGWRVHRKLEAIIREEMDRSGAQEVHLPALHPIELWEQSGRDQAMGATLFRLHDRREREFALGPTHEEVMTFMAGRHIQSYRDLPVTLYQIQTKFRDEQRPRGGLVRLREFTMKDAYSFDTDWDSLDVSYRAAFEAYVRIFARAGVPVLPVAADSGAIGGRESEEFVYLNPNGEDTIFLCPDCGYAANAEKADIRRPPALAAEPKALERVHTPGQRTIAELAGFLGIEERQTLKAVFFRVDGQPVFVAIRGDLDVNEVKLRNALKAADVEPLEEAAVTRAGLVAGSASPVGLKGLKVVADVSGVESPNLVAGANEEDYHLLNVNHGRDWTAEVVADLALARTGDGCPKCDGTLAEQRGMEMGHVFKLGTKYSEAMDVGFLDEKGEEHDCVMGCYGIGVERMLAAVLEEHHDKDGIIWPRDVAPFDCHVVVLNADQVEVSAALDELERTLAEAGLAALVDDREDSAGIKFKDADLLGMPVRLTVSPRALASGGLEFRVRSTGDTRIVPLGEVASEVSRARAEAQA
ncbi:MAG: proline--tRNA ligase [Dehalococcoidia bacterium]